MYNVVAFSVLVAGLQITNAVKNVEVMFIVSTSCLLGSTFIVILVVFFPKIYRVIFPRPEDSFGTSTTRRSPTSIGLTSNPDSSASSGSTRCETTFQSSKSSKLQARIAKWKLKYYQEADRTKQLEAQLLSVLPVLSSPSSCTSDELARSNDSSQ